MGNGKIRVNDRASSAFEQTLIYVIIAMDALDVLEIIEQLDEPQHLLGLCLILHLYQTIGHVGQFG